MWAGVTRLRRLLIDFDIVDENPNPVQEVLINRSSKHFHGFISAQQKRRHPNSVLASLAISRAVKQQELRPYHHCLLTCTSSWSGIFIDRCSPLFKTILPLVALSFALTESP